MPDLLTLMAFEAGELTVTEVAEMISEMVQLQGYESLTGVFEKLAKGYVRKGIMDEEGNLNYIKLNEEM